jgi:hypothetical protein
MTTLASRVLLSYRVLLVLRHFRSDRCFGNFEYPCTHMLSTLRQLNAAATLGGAIRSVVLCGV